MRNKLLRGYLACVSWNSGRSETDGEYLGDEVGWQISLWVRFLGKNGENSGFQLSTTKTSGLRKGIHWYIPDDSRRRSRVYIFRNICNGQFFVILLEFNCTLWFVKLNDCQTKSFIPSWFSTYHLTITSSFYILLSSLINCYLSFSLSRQSFLIYHAILWLIQNVLLKIKINSFIAIVTKVSRSLYKFCYQMSQINNCV